jgi:anaerobic magnesium-protoporphyrin IX monomethyl ester cyclase
MFGRRFRMRSVKNVVDELEYLYKTYGATVFTFCDDAFTVDQARAEEICDEIKRRKLEIKWNCGTRVDMLTKELLIKMKDAGCISVWAGVESGVQHLLDAMGKGIRLEQTIKVFGWLRELGLQPAPNVILGFPGETKQTAWKTVKFVEKISPDYLTYYNIATPFPGTPMYDMVKEKGWLKVTDFDKFDTATPVFETPMLSMKDLREIRKQAFHHFYLRPSYILRMFAKGPMHGLSATQTALEHLVKSIKIKLKNL